MLNVLLAVRQIDVGYTLLHGQNTIRIPKVFDGQSVAVGNEPERSTNYLPKGIERERKKELLSDILSLYYSKS